ncbi:MAG: CopD family protein [Steroidobacteraceae bacterium]|nr:CopD family protein [Nevskiaceae bacterium]
MRNATLLLHLLAATIWVGGHLILALAILPRALRRQSVAELLQYESAYERIGLPALLIQVISGVMLAHTVVPDIGRWVDLSDPIGRLVGLKLGLLALTAVFALDARLRLIPRLSSSRLTALAWHIIPVTVISVLFVVVGLSFRTGWFV